MKLYILEDEPHILQYLLQIVQKISYVQVIGYSQEAAKAAKEIPGMGPDVILADIRLKDGDSFGLFTDIGNETFQIIFLTAYDQYAIQALNLGAFGYLLKPIDEDALAAMLDKCFRYKEQERFSRQQLEVSRHYYQAGGAIVSKRIALKSLDYMEIIATEDIMYCKSDKGYTTFYLKDNNKIMVTKGLKDYETILEPFGFFRCHQSYLVNLYYVSKYYKEGYLQLKDRTEVPVSSRKREEVRQYLEHI